MPGQKRAPSLLDTLNEMEERLRRVERHHHPNNPPFFIDTDCIEINGRGTKTNPFFHTLRLNSDANNQIECTDEGMFVGGGQVVGWDATVDGTAVASDPDRRLFVGIGEACEYLDGLGMESVNIFVRNDHTDYSSASNLAYTETADWDCPASVHLFSARGGRGGLGANQEQTGVYWDWSTFKPTASGNAFSPPDFYIHDFHQVTIGAYTGTAALRGLYLYRSGFVASGSAWSGALCADLYAIDSWFDLTSTRTLASNVCSLNQCDVSLRNSSGGSATFVLGTSALTCSKTYLFNGSSSGTTTLTLPTRLNVDISTVSSLLNRTGIGANGTLALTLPAATTGLLRTNDPATGSGYSISSSNNMGQLRIEGEYAGISLTGTAHTALILDVSCDALTVGTPLGDSSGGRVNLIRAQTRGNVDLGGAALIDIGVSGPNSTVTLRGAINGRITHRSSGLSSGTFLSGVALKYSHITVAGNPTLTSGTAKSFALDATSDFNFLDFAADSLWPVAGTDAGAGNVIRVT